VPAGTDERRVPLPRPRDRGGTIAPVK